ncbi:unnamed protein product [Rhizophagus irregularis]|nr:unnamed protein product [Rhizophagus irregularis]
MTKQQQSDKPKQHLKRKNTKNMWWDVPMTKACHRLFQVNKTPLDTDLEQAFKSQIQAYYSNKIRELDDSSEWIKLWNAIHSIVFIKEELKNKDNIKFGVTVVWMFLDPTYDQIEILSSKVQERMNQWDSNPIIQDWLKGKELFEDNQDDQNNDSEVDQEIKECKFGERNIEFLGYIVGRDGLKLDVKKVEKIKEIKIPETVTQVRSFLGLCSYYRRFIKNFARIAKPLYYLVKKEVPFEWTEKQQEAFKELKIRLMEKPVLDHPNFEKEFILITDASEEGLGAVLSQKNEENKEFVIAYASRSLVGAEKNYAITELEYLAIFWGIKYFHKFLAGRKFTVITDHAALKGLMNAKVPTGRRARWVMELQQYDFEVIHRSGKENKNADALSRLEFEEKVIKGDLGGSDQEIMKMEHNKEKKLRYVRSGNEWFDTKRFRGK